MHVSNGELVVMVMVHVVGVVSVAVVCMFVGCVEVECVTVVVVVVAMDMRSDWSNTIAIARFHSCFSIIWIQIGLASDHGAIVGRF